MLTKLLCRDAIRSMLAAALLIAASISAAAQLSLAPPKSAAHPNSGKQMATLSAVIHKCLDRQATAVAGKPVDLETAAVAILARCGPELELMRNFLYTGIPNFTPGPDFWERDIEPAWKKEATKAVALARTRDPAPPASKPKPAAPPPTSNKNQI